MKHVQHYMKKQSDQGLSCLILLPKHAYICSKRVKIRQMFEAPLKFERQKMKYRN